MMKKISALLLACAIALPLSAADDSNKVVYPKAFTLTIPSGGKIRLAPDPGWVLERAWNHGALAVRLVGPDDRSKLEVLLISQKEILPEFAGPEKMKKAVSEMLEQEYYLRSAEKKNGVPLVLRKFSPGGADGFCSLRLTDAKWEKADPPAGEYKYLVAGIFRVAPDCVAIFKLITNDAGGADDVMLLKKASLLAWSLPGKPEWKVSNGAAAARLAEKVLAEKFPEADLTLQQPYNVELNGTCWTVRGARRTFGAGGTAEIRIDGPSGKILAAAHGK